MITSVHVAKLGPRAPVFRAPKPGTIPGLVQADGGMATRLGTSMIPVLDVTRAVPFLKANAEASANILNADGLAWACAFAAPPRFGTLSIWHSEEQMVANAYGEPSPGHEAAMKEERAKKFFKESVYVRLRPRTISGSIAGKNPIPENVIRLAPESESQ